MCIKREERGGPTLVNKLALSRLHVSPVRLEGGHRSTGGPDAEFETFISSPLVQEVTLRQTGLVVLKGSSSIHPETEPDYDSGREQDGDGRVSRPRGP